ncbi:MAG: hypothetical protein ACLSHJ_03995 [Oscillospiraceae bacterium]
MTLTSGSAGYSVDVWDMGAFPKPDLPFPEDTVKVSGVPSMAQHTVFATAQDQSKPLLPLREPDVYQHGSACGREQRELYRDRQGRRSEHGRHQPADPRVLIGKARRDVRE